MRYILLLSILFFAAGAAAVEISPADLASLAASRSAQPAAAETLSHGHTPPASRIYGDQLFAGNFRDAPFAGFNPDYQIAIGDRIIIRVWGAVTTDGVFTVDPQGNIFVPNLGPVPVLGVRNAELNKHIQERAQQIFRANVGIYATLDASQPVKVFVTGAVTSPGLYGGLSSDSLLAYLDKAGGVDRERGSYIDIVVLRNGVERKRINLYDFLLHGRLDLIQFSDGDTIVVAPRHNAVNVGGEVFNPVLFEFTGPATTVNDVLAMAKVRPGATHVSVVHHTGRERTSEYAEIDKAGAIVLQPGDEVSVLADRYSGTILVRVEGAHSGEHALILPYGARLQEVINRLVATDKSNLDGLQLYRRSVAKRQKEMLDTSLAALETQALTARSATLEEANLRGKEAEMILKFVDQARKVDPKGQVVLAGSVDVVGDTLLEDGDTIVIPEKSSLLMVHGEVMFPNAIVYTPGATPDDYIHKAGGYAQNADTSRILLFKENGLVQTIPADYKGIAPGDELMVLPKVDPKRLEIAKGFTQILYQIAIAARQLVW